MCVCQRHRDKVYVSAASVSVPLHSENGGGRCDVSLYVAEDTDLPEQANEWLPSYFTSAVWGNTFYIFRSADRLMQKRPNKNNKP